MRKKIDESLHFQVLRTVDSGADLRLQVETFFTDFSAKVALN